jgi:hypothetical protein
VKFEENKNLREGGREREREREREHSMDLDTYWHYSGF